MELAGQRAEKEAVKAGNGTLKHRERTRSRLDEEGQQDSVFEVGG